MIKNFIQPSKPMKITGKKRPLICEQTGDYFNQADEAAVFYGFARSAVSMVLSGSRVHAKGYTFRFATDDEIRMAMNEPSRT